QTDLCPSSRSRTREHGEVPLGSAFVEVEDEKGTVAALDFAIAVIWAIPLVEDFDPLDPIHVQTKRSGCLNPMVLACLDHDAHVSVSAAAQALSIAIYSISPCARACPLLAHSGHCSLRCKCLLSGAKRTWTMQRMSASDPKRTSD